MLTNSQLSWRLGEGLPAEGVAELTEGFDGEEGFVVEGDAEALLDLALELKAAEAVEMEVFLQAG